MPFQIIRNDITSMSVDAIVTTADTHLHPGGGVNGSIHQAAGPQLEEAARKLGGCAVGMARITPGFRLPCRFVIHTVSPVWQGTAANRAQLTSCYREALQLAAANGCRSVAFPLIAAGAHGCPHPQALRIATDAITHFLLEQIPDNDLMVYLVLFSQESFFAGSQLFADVRQYIDDRYVEEHFDLRLEQARANYADYCSADVGASMDFGLDFQGDCAAQAINYEFDTLEDALSQLDESFSQMLQRLILERNLKNADCYKRANIDKKLFSKIVNNDHYKPRKTTALALAVALELSPAQTRELLMTAGLALSHSDKFDIIVEFFLQKGCYDIFEINEMLYAFGQPPLGGVLA